MNERGSAPESIKVGQTISHYKILEKLGGGGMGVVYKAEDIKLKRLVALKFLPPHWSHDLAAKERFLTEAQSASAIDHPNVCGIHEIDETEDGRLFIVMSYCKGETLKKKIDRGYLTIEQCADVAQQVAEGLSKAHTLGIIHRDIKPANLMVTDEGIVKIVDFGLAKFAGVSRVSRRDHAVGTVLYMSPEQLHGEEVDARTDIWSLGAVLYEMVSGRGPFEGEYDQAVAYAIVNEEPQPLSALRPGVPKHIEQIVEKALVKDREARYRRVEEMLEDLQKIREVSGPRSVRLPSERRVSQASIAVLPFADLSPGQDQEYFCDGVADELISAMAKIEGLRVVSRTSTLQFRGKGQDIRSIGEQLTVGRILEGSVRKAGNRVRITVQLINVADGYHLWSDRYDRSLEDIFATQDEIAKTVVDHLRIKLTEGMTEPLVAPHTEDVEAYTLYLRGRHLWNKRTEENLSKSTDYFRQAIDRDPLYARAHAGLADAYATQGVYGARPPKEVMPRAKAAAQQALELDSTLAEAHTSLGCVLSFYDWSWQEAEATFKRAIELDPNYATAHHWYAMNCLSPMGRFDEALDEIKRAQTLDPLSPAINASLGLQYYYDHHYDEAVKRYLGALELDAGFAMAHYFLGQAYAEIFRYEDAIDAVRTSIQLSGGSAQMTALFGYIYAVSGERGRAEAVIEELNDRSKQKYVSFVLIAQIHAGLKEIDAALDCLKKAYEDRSADLAWLGVLPMFDSLRHEPSFIALLEKTGLR
jgi:serine/threonine-protein kinase